MRVRRPGPLGEEDVPLAALSLGYIPGPASLQRTDKGACTRTRGCSFSWSDDSFQFTKDSGQGSEKSGWLIVPMTSLCREQGRRGVTLQIPEALQWDVGSVQVAVIYGIGMGQDSSCSMQIG